MRIAVTGATGKLGGQVIALLAAHGGHEIVGVSRRALSDPAPRVRSAEADYADRAALRAAFDEVDTLVFVSSDGEATNVLSHHQNVISAATEAGVGHVVLMSALDADIASPFCYAVTSGLTEALLRDRCCAISIARTSIFTEFFLQFLSTARARGEIRVPAGSGRISMVSIADVGRCLAALALGPPTGRIHKLTGPASLDMHEVAAHVMRAWRVPVAYVDLSPAEFQQQLATDGVDPWWCYAFSSMFASIRQHRWEQITDEVLRLTCRPPQPLSQLIAD
ncbi:MAG: NAD(P)H-binding protein [Marmoricola sp.]